jgi:hypothetical protein
MTDSKREGYVNLELDDMSDMQEMVVNMFINEGQLREQDAVWDLLVKNSPPVEGDTEFIHGYKAGYAYAMHVVEGRIHGPAEPEMVESQEVEEEFDITDVDDPE